MTQQIINTVILDRAQAQLDQQLGPGLFVLTLDRTTGKDIQLMEYADTTPPDILDQALTIIQQQVTLRKLLETRNRLYHQIQGVADKAIQRCFPDPVTDLQAQQCQDWLDNPDQPCPASVILSAGLAGLNIQEQAQRMIQSNQTYKNFVIQIRSYQDLGQQAVLTAADMPSLKAGATINLQAINELEAANQP